MYLFFWLGNMLDLKKYRNIFLVDGVINRNSVWEYFVILCYMFFFLLLIFLLMFLNLEKKISLVLFYVGK